jgi:hypothetical protein
MMKMNKITAIAAAALLAASGAMATDKGGADGKIGAIGAGLGGAIAGGLNAGGIHGGFSVDAHSSATAPVMGKGSFHGTIRHTAGTTSSASLGIGTSASVGGSLTTTSDGKGFGSGVNSVAGGLSASGVTEGFGTASSVSFSEVTGNSHEGRSSHPSSKVQSSGSAKANGGFEGGGVAGAATGGLIGAFGGFYNN